MFNINMDANIIMMYSNAMSLIAIGIAIIYWYFFIHIRGNLFLLKKVGNTYFQVARLRVKKDEEKADYKNKSYIIKPSFFDGDKPNVYIDYETGEVLSLNIKSEGLSPIALDIFIGDNILSQLAKSLGQYQLSLIFLIVSFVTGVFIGLFIHPYLPIPSV